MFNAEQLEHMRDLAATDPAKLAWCGWYSLVEDPHSDCPKDLTLVDKLRQRCEICGNAPVPTTGRMIHTMGCTVETRREFYASVELGEAGA